MNEHPETDEALARLLDRTLRELPSRRAPMTLEPRVFNALRRRAVLPWWRRTFAYWPGLARATFLLICGCLAGLALLVGDWAATGVRLMQTSGASVSWVRQVVTIVNVASDLAALLSGAIPAAWLYGSLTAGALLYAALFGLGAAAYRILYLKPFDGR
jgi:hypothetical protein